MRFIDLDAQYQNYKTEIDMAISGVVESCQFVNGEPVQLLEKELAEFVNAPYALTCSNGTDALLISLMVLGVGPGDEIITPTFSFVAAAEVAAFLGATVVPIDIEEKTFNIDCAQLTEKITNKTKAIIPVSLFGQVCDLDEIQKYAGNIPIIEDAAQSFGASYKGKKSGSIVRMSTTSFFPAKPLGAFGEGGALFFLEKEDYEKAKRLRDHGSSGRYNHVEIGMNGRLDTLQAAILRVKLKHFSKEVNIRNNKAKQYDEKLSEINQIVLPFVSNDNISVYAQYCIRVPQREKLQDYLKERNVPTAVHYPRPIHLQPCFAELGYKEGDFPISEMVAKDILGLPMSAFLKDEDLNKVCSELQGFFTNF